MARTAYQLWNDKNGHAYVPSCASCGEYLRSSPVYDGGGPHCSRARCRKKRGAAVVARCTMDQKHFTGEGCSWEGRA